MNSLNQVFDLIKENNIEFVDFKIADLFGRWRHLTIPSTELNEELLEEGIGFDGSNYGFSTVSSSDMLFKPDLSFAWVDRFYQDSTLSLIGNVYEASKEVVRSSQDPRAVAERAEKLLRESNNADVYLLPELEFYVFDSARFSYDVSEGFFMIDSENAFWNSRSENSRGYFPRKQDGYHTSLPLDCLADLRNDIVSQLQENGVRIKYHHHEVGGSGQVELETGFGRLLEMADNTLLIKYIIKNTAANYGKTATFMPKCLYGEAGNGMHVHQFFTSEGENIFHSDDGYENLSQTALYYIGGLLYHADSICAFTNASTNSYRRMVPGYEAPVSKVFSPANRSAAVRIPTYVRNPRFRRIEYRPIDATCNPYLAYSAMVLAGLDGIINKIDPREEGFGPFEGNIFELSREQLSKIKHFPKSLEEALEALQFDHKFLLRGEVFNEVLIENWIKMKEKEIAAINERPHPYEFMLYYDL